MTIWSVPRYSVLPTDRLATINWQNAGMRSLGGIPTTRTQSGSTLTPSGGDDTTQIQAALDACPANKYVLLGAGTFLITSIQTPLIMSVNNTTLRGSGAGSTIIRKYNGGAVVRKGSNVTGTTLAIPGDTSLAATFTNGSANIGVTNGLVAGDFGTLSTTGALPTNFATSTTYYVISTGLSGSNIQLSATKGGSAITAGSAGSGTHTFNITYDNAPIILVGPGRFAGVDNSNTNSSSPTSTSNLTADGVRGSYSIAVADGSIFTVGKFVLLDELTMPSYTATPRGFLDNNTNGTEGTVLVMAGDRVVMNRHKTGSTIDSQNFQDDPPAAWGWFSRPDPVNVAISAYTDGRVTCEIKEIASINGNVITFTSPLTISYRKSNTAQLTKYTTTPATGNSVHVTGCGVENLTLYRSGGGGLFFNCAAYSWAKNIEIDTCFGLGIQLAGSFRCEVRDSYIHTSAQPTPAADSYAINPSNGSSELLIENNIMRDYCKVIAFRACGAGSVVSYNYTDDGWDWYNTGNTTTDGDYAAFAECGINASHMAGPHHVLFEGNYSFNADSDYTHGNSIYITFFRNWLTGKRASVTTETGDRCGGGAMFSWWISYIGNVLGRSGQMAGWSYTDSRMGCDGGGDHCVTSPSSGWTNATNWSNKSLWKVGYDPERWPCNPDLQTLSTLIRDGNYDFVTTSQKWHNTPATFPIPESLYLTSKPSFFTTNAWPWVNPATGSTGTLPAKKRYDDGTPNVVP